MINILNELKSKFRMNNKIFVCDFKDCQLFLKEPVVLPCCGSTICEEHKNNFEIENGKYKCLICSEQEFYPENGFPLNKKIMNLMDNGEHLNEVHKNVFNSILKLESIIKEHESINSDEIIYDYFAELRNQVDLHRDQIIEQIHKKSQEILALLKEQEVLFKMNSENLFKSDLNQIKQETLLFWKNRMRNPLFTEAKAKILLDKITDKTNKINFCISKYKNDCLMNSKIDFIPLQFENYFGELKIEKRTKFEETTRFIISNEFGKMVRSFNKHKDCVRSIQLVKDSNKLISASQDKTINIWDLENSERLKALEGHTNWVTCVLIDNNNNLISGSRDKTIKIWNLDNYECITTLTNSFCVWSLLLLSDNSLASGSGDGSINIWNLNERKIVKSLKAHEKLISCLIKTKNTAKLISGSFDSTIKIWSLKKFELLKELIGHTGHINCLEILNYQNLLSGSSDKTIKIWNISSGECLKTVNFNGSVKCFETFNNHEMLIIGIGSGKIEGNDIILYSLKKNKRLKRYSAHSNFVSKLTLLSDGSLLTSSENGQIKLWNLLELKSNPYEKL
jgi:WD40 repeat protein